MAALDNIASELLKSANEADLIYKRTRDQAQRDKAVRLRRIVENLKAISAGGLTPTLDEVLTEGNVSTNTLNVGGITSDYFQFDTAATPTLAPGMFAWNDAYGTADLRLKGNNVTLQVGQETLARVVNKTGSDLLESQYKVVRVRIASEGGAQGQRLAVVLAQGDNDPDSATTLGVVTETILNNQEGFITIFGNVNNINTTGSLQGETWVDGDVLYLSPTTPGALTKVKPVAPQHTLIVGYVVYAHINQGKIFVKVDNGYELDELHNVLITSPANNDLLQYNSTQQVWKNIPVGTAVPTPTLAQVTTAGNTTTNAITVGGLTSTLANADVTHVGANAKGFYVRNNADSLVRAGLQFDGNTAFVELLGRYQNGATFIRQDGANGNISFLRAGSEYVRIFGATGNTAIGTTTDAGYKLDVNGTARVQGNLTVSGSQNYFSALNGYIFFSRGAGTGINFTPANVINAASQNAIVIMDSIYGGVSYAGGTHTFNALAINTNISTGGSYNGIVRGIYYNPTLTSLTGVTHRAIETTSGNVIFNGGNVGIGTSSPTDKFHIVDNTNGNKFGRISAGGTDASAAWVAQNDQVDNIVYRVFGSAVTGSQMGQALARSASLIANLGGTGKFLIGSFSATDLIFGTSDQARMRLVDATGNFLIGTMTDTGNKLTVSGNIDAQGYKVNNVLGYTGILNIPTNPPGQQNIDIQGGIVINIF